MKRFIQFTQKDGVKIMINPDFIVCFHTDTPGSPETRIHLNGGPMKSTVVTESVSKVENDLLNFDGPLLG